MKDQYFGDINDYRKYGILRLLTGAAALPLTVCWMLTPSDGRNDGSSISYLLRPERWRHFDPPLFDLLRDAVHAGTRLGTSSAPQLRFLERAAYVAPILADGAADRARYFDLLLKLPLRHGLLFFDPDNGLEVRSVPYGRKNSSKYLYWHELTAAHGMGLSVLLYQHFPRRERRKYMHTLAGECFRRLKVRECIMIQTPRVLFVLLPESGKERYFRERTEAIAHRWTGELRVFLFTRRAGAAEAVEIAP